MAGTSVNNFSPTDQMANSDKGSKNENQKKVDVGKIKMYVENEVKKKNDSGYKSNNSQFASGVNKTYSDNFYSTNNTTNKVGGNFF